MTVVDVSSDNWSDGAGPIDTVKQAAADLMNPEDWVMDGIALGLDGLGVIADPLANLASAGIGWLIEHVSFLKEPLDNLAGDPAAINRVAAVWGEQVRTEIANVGDDFGRAATEETTSWKGPAADAYRTYAATLRDKVKGLEPTAESVSHGVQGAGALVSTVRGIIRDIVVDVVGEFIAAAATALASSWFTLGGSIAAFIGWAVGRGAATAGKIAGKISKLLNKLSNILNKFDKLSGAARALAKLAQKFKATGKTLGKTAARHGKDVRQMQGALDDANDLIRNKADVGGLKDFTTKVDEGVDIRRSDGFADTINPKGIAITSVVESHKEATNIDENYNKAKEELAEEGK